MGFSRQEYWSGLPFPIPGDLLNPGIEPTSLVSPALAGVFFTTSTMWEALILLCMRVKSLQSCLTLCDLMDHSLPGSSVHRILQVRILEWVTMPFSRGYSFAEYYKYVNHWVHHANVDNNIFVVYIYSVYYLLDIVVSTLHFLLHFIAPVTLYGSFFFLPAAPWGMWDLSSPTRGGNCTSCIAGSFFTHWVTWETCLLLVGNSLSQFWGKLGWVAKRHSVGVLDSAVAFCYLLEHST